MYENSINRETLCTYSTYSEVMQIICYVDGRPCMGKRDGFFVAHE